MANAREVLAMLIPNGGYVMTGETFEGIEFLDCDPITKKQFADGFAQFDAFKQQQETEALAAKEAAHSKLSALGLTADDLKALGL